MFSTGEAQARLVGPKNRGPDQCALAMDKILPRRWGNTLYISRGGIDDFLTSPSVTGRRREGFIIQSMTLFDYQFDLRGHDETLRQLNDIIEEYQRACYATGKRVDQPHLKETARKAIQSLSPFYTESDAERLLERALSRARPGTSRQPPAP